VFLVTGGAGFIGSDVVWALNQRSCADVVISDFTPSPEKQHNLATLTFRSYADPLELLTLLHSGSLGRFDFAFHLGACPSTMQTDESYLRKNNLEYTRELARWAIAEGVRFVYASSAVTYGDGGHGMDDSDLSRLTLLRPLNPYGRSKHTFDVHAYDQGWFDKNCRPQARTLPL
jgi:ADP-L-glycero-D-manno-heptose 6-epimerase